MEFIILFLILPVVVAFASKLLWPRELTYAEMGGVVVIGFLLGCAVYATGVFSQTHDQEIWNGQVTSKSKDRVSCRHSYSCHCHTSCSGSGNKRSCSQHCDTCYEHPYDIDWDVHSNLGTFGINTIDRQGLMEPPRWTIVKPGDPVSNTHSFTNYVKAVPDSLFHANTTHTFDKLIPAYPDGIYDYYKLNRTLAMGVNIPDISQWNDDISNILRTLGPSKQANIIIIFVNTADESYLHALEGAWVGGKKNDIIVIIGATHYPAIDWVAVSSWTDKALFKVQLRDDIMSLKTVDRVKIIQAIQTDTAKMFQRKHMKDFEYLRAEISPPDWVLTLAIVLCIVASLVAAYVFHRNEVRG